VRDERPGDLRFQTCLEESHLAQLVTFPTYRNSRKEAPKSTLDLLITDDPDRLIEITEIDSLGYTPMGQAHCMISCTIALTGSSDSPTTTLPRLIWSKANYEAIISFFASCDWFTLFNDRPANVCYNLLVEKYNKAIKQYIPTTTAPFKLKEELWVTQEVLEAVELKRELWGKYLSAGRQTHELIREQHKTASKNVARVVKQAVLYHEEELARSAKTDPKRLHSHVRKKRASTRSRQVD
jgi:hypothetical protein